MKRKTPSGPRDEIDRSKSKMLARRDSRGRFTEMKSEGRSIARDRRQHARHRKPPRQGDKGD